jgi:hypothetical protein
MIVFPHFLLKKCLISAVFPLRHGLSVTISGARQIAVKDSGTGKPLQTYPNHFKHRDQGKSSGN